VVLQLFDERDVSELGQLFVCETSTVYFEVGFSDEFSERLLEADEADGFILRVEEDQVHCFDERIDGLYFRLEQLLSVEGTWNAASSLIKKSEKSLNLASIGSIFLKNLTEAEKTQKSENLFCGARFSVRYLPQKPLKSEEPRMI